MNREEQENLIRQIEERLRGLEGEKRDLALQLGKARNDLSRMDTSPAKELGRPTLKKSPESPAEKISLFLSLFRCRPDVFPKRWENRKTGKSGYSPTCTNEWVKPICKKPEIKCSECKHQAFPPFDEVAAELHLKGHQTVGTYAITAEDTCTFLACDFDEGSWRDDVNCYRDMGSQIGIDVAVERSRSGEGAHAWIFFDEQVPARIARQLGTLILAKCSEQRAQISLDSYDRFFPSQDYLPRGGFGNLIALPLQRTPRENGNSCFLDTSLSVIADQWGYLAGVRRLNCPELRSLLDKFSPSAKDRTEADAFDDVSWLTDQAIIEEAPGAPQPQERIEGQIEIALGAMIRVPLANLPGSLVGKLKKIASFANPEFYKAQRMRMPVYRHPRFIVRCELHPEDIVLPRGVLDETVRILSTAGASVVIRDERLAKKKIKAEFLGKLTDEQELAVRQVKKNDMGILMAPPGAGKTVMACSLIGSRKVSTLILLHRGFILDQWKERILQFLNIDPKDIGTLGGSKKKTTGKLDLVMLQTLTRMEDISEIAQNYSQIIIDECHHIPATSFEAILRQVPARYVVGLTATPYRKDGMEKILFHQCGPIRHEIKSVDGGKLGKRVTITETGFRFPNDFSDGAPYHNLVQCLITDEGRNEKVAIDVVSALTKGRFPVLLSDRKEHLDTLTEIVLAKAKNEETLKNLLVVRLDGSFSQKQRKHAVSEATRAREARQPILLVATASLVGEGFDLPALDTLILALPLSFEGRMIQYAGRLHRLTAEKTDVEIFDYVDSYSATFLGMYKKRVKTYRKMGYSVQEPPGFATRSIPARKPLVRLLQTVGT